MDSVANNCWESENHVVRKIINRNGISSPSARELIGGRRQHSKLQLEHIRLMTDPCSMFDASISALKHICGHWHTCSCLPNDGGVKSTLVSPYRRQKVVAQASTAVGRVRLTLPLGMLVNVRIVP